MTNGQAFLVVILPESERHRLKFTIWQSEGSIWSLYTTMFLGSQSGDSRFQIDYLDSNFVILFYVLILYLSSITEGI